MSRLLAIATLTLIALAWAAPAAAQCAMCREAASAQREEVTEAFNRAILLLGAPPALILAGIGRALWRRRDSPEVAPPTAGLQ